ncbi:MAG: hypothetical protein LBT04_07210, partial [Prevotellaceae bacterium]|nr:hypothetical protein [Prevotellaceae bacterium]
MAYLFRTLKKWNKKKLRLIEMPPAINSNIPKWLKKHSKLYARLVVLYLRVMTSKKDVIFFTEFLDTVASKQTISAEKLRQNNVRAKLFGLVHLSEKHLLEVYGDETYIKEKLKLLDKIVVLGSSLGNYFSRLGFDQKVVSTFHYVENSYYKPIEAKKENQRLRVIAMDSLKRNFTDLKTIVAATPDIDYDICMGALSLEDEFSAFDNVTLHGYLSDSELLQLMQGADVGLSVLEDTVGSNVITTSLACGLAQIVSDVGSIRDYC